MKKSSKSSGSRRLYACVKKAKRIKLLILDVDGVLTDGRIILDDRGRELKFFDVKDGHGIALAHRAGLTTAIISGRNSKVVNIRARELGIKIVYQNSLDKLKSYQSILKKTGLKDAEVAFIGDDLIDIPLLKKVGFSIAVADALPYVKDAADMVTEKKGGRGAVREAIEFILDAKGLWKEIYRKYVRN
ncbi:MAG: HAD-IIIA family hydrolase [Nitrospinae bacterium]|nr:HAD-IIIA family hydrolase [Nitrospinota bacterium]